MFHFGVLLMWFFVQLLGGTSEGPGVCDARAQPPKSKTTTQRQEIPPRQAAAKINSSQPAHLTVTHPSIPSQEGKHHTQSTHYQRETSTQTSPLERGRGCVTSVHSYLNQKHPPEAQEIPPLQTAAESSYPNPHISP